MAVPQTKVYIAFDLQASGQNFFVLDDTTKGVLDSVYVLGGDILQDVTNYVQSVSVDRGKSRELDKYSTGNANIVLHNDSRIFDPFNSASVYFGQISPRKQVAIETNGNRIFTGYIEDWDFTYDISGKSYASVSALDGFMLLASAQLDTFTTTSQLSSDRINVILSRPEVAWPIANRDIENGVTTLQADVVPDNNNALSYLQLVESTENGMLFVNRSGAVTFRNRATDPTLVPVVFADDGTTNSIQYTNINAVYGSENFYNRVSVSRLGGTNQIANSIESQTKYGVSSLSISGLLMQTNDEALNLASYLTGLFDEPELRINQITVALHDKTPEEVEALVTTDIGDAVEIRFTPNQTGSPIVKNAAVIGVSQSIGLDSHDLTLSLGSVAYFPFLLDDLIYGILDNNILSY